MGAVQRYSPNFDEESVWISATADWRTGSQECSGHLAARAGAPAFLTERIPSGRAHILGRFSTKVWRAVRLSPGAELQASLIEKEGIKELRGRISRMWRDPHSEVPATDCRFILTHLHTGRRLTGSTRKSISSKRKDGFRGKSGKPPSIFRERKLPLSRARPPGKKEPLYDIHSLNAARSI